MPTFEETYNKYADDLNTHADQCELCAASRKMSDTRGCCEEGRKLVEAFKEYAIRVMKGEVDIEPQSN